MALRWYIENEDGSGYIMPIGAQCEEMGSIYAKNDGTPAFATDNPPMTLRFTGVATNQNATPTVAQVQSAIETLQDFCFGNDKITKVRLREVSGSSNSMGGTLGSAPGTVVKDYDVAFENSGWEVMNFSVMDIVEKQNFSFKVLIANLYPNTPGQEQTISVGADIQGADFQQSKSIQDGMVRTVVTAALKLRKRSQVVQAINIAIELASSNSISPASVYSSRDIGFDADTTLTFDGQGLDDGNIETMQVSYNPMTMDFSCTIIGVKPTDRSPEFSGTTGVRVTATADIDNGFVTTRLKGFQKFVGLSVQRSHSKEVSMTINIQIIALQKIDDYQKTVEQVDKLIGDMDFGSFAYMGGGWGRSTGNISLGTGITNDEDVEAGNTWTRSIHLIGAETELPPSQSAAGGRPDIERDALEILEHVSLAVVLGTGTMTTPIEEIGRLNRG
jgi:hypothetical protein